ncbi:sister chromatid cohesion protein PDS5 homolog A-like isoform X1 [Primulina tabacum]|uniref:sister chromatid cohesion protein PDS5 homolog A-like isoform X1 n=1 Tax=Primulina tabacum TaxID=48773 RepID=UPI003F5AB34D
MTPKQLQQQLRELGAKLENPPASKDALIKVLKQGASCLSELDQSPPKPVMESMDAFLTSIAKPELIRHQDREVKLFVAVCICEITRITAPEAPYDDDVLKDIFELIVGTFSGLSDINGPSFGRRVVILETLARYRSCVVMLDLDCDDLVNEMFNTFFKVTSDEHPENALTSMQTIMEVLFEESEDVPENLLLIILSALGPNKENISSAARRLAMNVIEHCAGKLEHGIKQFLISSMSGDKKFLNSEINYHGVLYDVYRCAPQILSGVVPYLTGELLSDQLDVRLKAVGLVGDLFTLPGSTISESFQPVFLEFLKRMTDRVVEVRMSVLEHVKTFLLANPSRVEAPQIISALSDRLLDYDENVRKQVVCVVCDVACRALSSIPVETIKLVAERLRDKSILVKRYTLERLADIYRASCIDKSSETTKNVEYDWIFGKVLRCFYDKDFRSDIVEPILSLSLFPDDFSVKDKVLNWIRIFSGFDKVEVKALEKILEQKQRLQQEMQKYISLRQSSQVSDNELSLSDFSEGDVTELRKKVTFCFRVMSRYFIDPAKAEENFQLLDQLKDSNIWKNLTQLLDPNTDWLQACSSRDDLLGILGPKHRLYEFLGSLSLKCSCLLFNKDHVREILLEAGVQKSSGSNELILACMTILVILARFCPSMLAGIEEDLVHLLEDDNEIIKEGTLHILAKAGGTIREQLGVSSRSLDLILERICIEGSRRQAKYAVHALASITKDDGLMSLSVLYKRLVDMLEDKSHLPAVLQSLGCIAQAAMPVFETREREVEKFIKENILECSQVAGDHANDSWDGRSELCSLKIFGVKALVKSYLPVKDPHLRSGIDDLVLILKNILTFGEYSSDIKSSLVEMAHLKLAAAKAVLRLSKHWEHKIPVDVFYLTLRTSEDGFPEVKRLLLNKVHQYVKDRILDPKYACAFLLDFTSQQSDLEENKRNLNDIIQMCWQSRARQILSQTDGLSSQYYPEYILPYVVHSLAHHPTFPNVDECKDVKEFELLYRQLYLFLSMLVHGDGDGKSEVNISKDKESTSLLNSIFLQIKCSEDAFDSTKSKNLYALCDLGMSIIKRLASKEIDPQNSSASVTLPPVLYKLVEKKEDGDSLVGEVKTWLAEDSVLAHFESIKLEANGIINSEIAEDDIMKDSDSEGSEMPLGKLMKRLKAKIAKTRKEVKSESSPAEAAKGNNFDILKMVEEINSDIGTSSKLESSNGHEYVNKKRSGQKLQKRKSMLGETTNVPVPKRRRSSSAQAHKSRSAITSKDSKGHTDGNQEEIVNVSNKIDKELPSSSEDHSMQEKTSEPPESELLVACIKNKPSSVSKQKSKRTYGDDEAFDKSSVDAKKPKKVTDSSSPHRTNYSKLGSVKKQKEKSVTALQKDNRSSMEDLIGCTIKVWWPMDKQFYEGIVKSFDTEKKKHVILYEDGDVEVLRLDKERWELVDNGKKVDKRSSSSKSFHPKEASSGKKSRATGSIKLEKKAEEKSPSSQIRGKRTPRKSPKQKTLLKIKSSMGSGGSPDVTNLEFTKPSMTESDSEQEQNEKSGKILAAEKPSDKDNKQLEDGEKGLRDAEEPKEEENDSEDTQSDRIGGSRLNADGSDHEAVSSSDMKHLDKIKEQSGQEDEETDTMDGPALTDEADKKSPTSLADAELSDDETLSTWKQRAGKK